MRVLLLIKFPHHKFNAAVKDGSADAKMNAILEASKPEAVYYTEHQGHRALIVVVDLADAAGIPALAEPWFLTFEADVEIRTVMTAADIKRAGLAELGKKWA